jgi:NAD(P)-dependent dehydrogenase (short-subunit alcohol dehydrogenase family)
MSLNGKHALITGSSRGIGRGIALKLAADGVKVAIHYYRNEAAANDTLEQVRKRGSDGLVLQADVTRPEQITAMFRKVRNSPWAHHIRHLRRLSGRGRTTGAPFGTSRGRINGESSRASRESARHREGRCPCGKTSELDTS